MRSEDPLRALSAFPHPRLSPFFAARVAARAAEAPAPRPGRRLMPLFWLVLASVAGTALAGTSGGVVVMILVAGSAAFPRFCVLLLAGVAAGLSGRRGSGPGP